MSFFRSRFGSLIRELSSRSVGPQQPKLLATDYQDINPVSTGKIVLQVLGIVFKALIALIVVICLLIAGTIAVLLGTIISVPQIEGERLIVQRNTWPLGDAPIGEIVASNSVPKAEGFLEKLNRELTQTDEERFVTVIVAQPGDRVRAMQGQQVLVNGVPTRFTSDKNIASILLTDDYLGICINGGCGTPGTPISIPSDHLIGSVQGKLSGIGIDRYEVPSFLE